MGSKALVDELSEVDSQSEAEEVAQYAVVQYSGRPNASFTQGNKADEPVLSPNEPFLSSKADQVGVAASGLSPGCHCWQPEDEMGSTLLHTKDAFFLQKIVAQACPAFETCRSNSVRCCASPAIVVGELLRNCTSMGRRTLPSRHTQVAHPHAEYQEFSDEEFDALQDYMSDLEGSNIIVSDIWWRSQVSDRSDATSLYWDGLG